MAGDSHTSDSQLVTSTLAGNKACFGDLVARYWNMIVAVVTARTGNPVEAEDVAQEAFVRAYVQLHTLRDASQFPGWLCRIALHEATDRTRKARRENLALTTGIPYAECTEAPEDPPDPGVADRRRNLVRQAIGGLPAHLQAVILMRFMGGMSAPQIAQQLGKRAGTIRVWLHRAYGRLRGQIGAAAEEMSEP